MIDIITEAYERNRWPTEAEIESILREGTEREVEDALMRTGCTDVRLLAGHYYWQRMRKEVHR